MAKGPFLTEMLDEAACAEILESYEKALALVRHAQSSYMDKLFAKDGKVKVRIVQASRKERE